jgi:phosphoribosylcarboxyaminoimidazole (NCAIR) mutase
MAPVTLEVAPVPVSATVFGLLEALLAIVKAPVRCPVAVGLNYTVMAQVAAAARDAAQVLV